MQDVIVRFKLGNFLFILTSGLLVLTLTSLRSNNWLRMVRTCSHNLVISIFVFLASATRLAEWCNTLSFRLRELVSHAYLIILESSGAVTKVSLWVRPPTAFMTHFVEHFHFIRHPYFLRSNVIMISGAILTWWAHFLLLFEDFSIHAGRWIAALISWRWSHRLPHYILTCILFISADVILVNRTWIALTLCERWSCCTSWVTLRVLSLLGSLTARDFGLGFYLNWPSCRGQIERRHAFLDIFSEAHDERISAFSLRYKFSF